MHDLTGLLWPLCGQWLVRMEQGAEQEVGEKVQGEVRGPGKKMDSETGSWVG